MDYIRLMAQRKSTRAYRKKSVPEGVLDELRHHFHEAARLVSDIEVGLILLGNEANEKLEGIAGYNGYMIGAPAYALLVSGPGEHSVENAGYLGMDLLMKITELDLDSCWLTFGDGQKVRAALDLPGDKEVTALIAFGYGKRESNVNVDITNTSQVDFSRLPPSTPRITVEKLVHFGGWEDKTPPTDPVLANFGLSDSPAERMTGMPLYAAFLAVTQAPTFLNRQPYSLIVDEGTVSLVSRRDEYTNTYDARLNTGIVLFSFAAALSQRMYRVSWTMGDSGKDYGLPEDCRVEAWMDMNKKPF